MPNVLENVNKCYGTLQRSPEYCYAQALAIGLDTLTKAVNDQKTALQFLQPSIRMNH